MSYSIKVVCRISKKSGVTSEAPICIRITKDRKSTYKTLYKIKPEYWDEKKGLVRKSHPNANELNANISKEKLAFEKDVLNIKLAEKSFNIDAIRSKINYQISTDFFDYAQKYLEGLNKVGNASLYKRYKTVITKFKNFLQIENLPIGNFSQELVLKYEKHLIGTLKNQNNTVTANMKVLSKLVGDIYREYRLDSIDNPFNSYKYKSDETERNHLSSEEIKRIKSLKIGISNPLYDAKQVFLFECCTGIRISDILTLRWKNLNGECISFNMRKTERNNNIPLSIDALDIINRKADVLLRSHRTIPPNKYIFNILKTDIDTMNPIDAYNSISSATAIINRRLKTIANRAKIGKNISTHVGRHTFATNLITQGVDIYVVKELLGHQDLKITQIYAKVVDSKKAEAIKKLNY
jgi:integrase/recombinase XerD